MNDYPSVSLDIVQHNIEIYTSRLIVQGTISGQYRRISDLLNRRDDRFLTIENATISYVGQDGKAQKLDQAVSLARASIQFVAVLPQTAPAEPQGTNPMVARDQYIVKNTHPCTAITDIFNIRGQCHLRDGFPLMQFLEMVDPFIPITQAAFSVTLYPELSWQRELVIVNKEKIETMYQEDQA